MVLPLTAFNRAMAVVVQQLGAVVWGGWQVRTLRLHDVEAGPERRSAPHAHAWCELSVVARGTLAYGHAGREHLVAPGGIFAMAPGRRHGWRVAAAPALITGYQLQFTPLSAAARAGLAAWWERIDAGACAHPSTTTALALVEALHERADQSGLCAHLVRAHLCWCLAALDAGQEAPASLPDQADRLPSVREYVLEHLDEPLSLATLARRFALSPRHLNRLFVASEGRPLHRFLIDQRLERAAQTLLGRDEPVAAVARSVGYQDPGYFGRLFRQRFGASPERWRSSRR